MSRSICFLLVSALCACFAFVAPAMADDVDSIEIDDVNEKADPIPAPATPAPTPSGDDHDWTGAYLGGHLGYFRGTDEATWSFGTRFNITDNAFIGGGLLGYNHAFGNFVIGLEFDAADLATHKTRAVPATSPASELEWNTHYRARFGYAFDRWLPFASLGLAVAEYKISLVPGGLVPVATLEDVLLGVSVGGGLDFALTDHIVLRGEYLYDNYGKQSMFGGGTVGVTPGFPGQVSNVSSHTLRVAASWQF